MGLLTRSSRRQRTSLLSRTARQIAGRLFESLEERRLYTAAPTLNIAGPSIVTEGATYTLALSAAGANVSMIDHWTINWGDTQTTTFAGNPSQATHVYADGPSSAIITGSATLADGTNVPANLGGAAADNGTLDPSFNGTGKVTIDPGGSFSFAKGVAVQSDGKIVEAGSTDGVASIARLNADGSLDTTFNGTGKLVNGFGISFVATAVSMQTVAGQEKILVAGNTSFHSALVRLNLDGTLDATFGSGGISQFSIAGFFNNLDGIRGMAVMPDGRIVTAGVAQNRNNSTSADIALARFNADGTPDLTFNGTGQLTTDLGGNADTALKVLLNPDNSIVVLSQGFTTAGFHTQLLRYTVAGVLDPSFGVGGVATLALPNQFFGEGAAIDASGNILVSGNVGGAPTDLAVARFTPLGAVDGTFGSGGLVSTFLDVQNDDASSVAIQSDGKILLGGSTTSFFVNGGTGDNFVIERLNADGSQDSTFGSGADRWGNVGVVRVDFNGGNDDSTTLVFTNDGRAVLAGAAFNIAGSSSQVAIAQFGSVGSSSSPVTVNITNANPTVSITGLPASSNEGTPLNLSANANDPSPVDTAAGFTYSWVVSKDNAFYASGTSANFVLNPDDNGLYQVTIFVHDKDGGAASDTENITINNVAPTVTTTGAPATSPEGTAISAGASATDPSPIDTAAGFTYSWSVTKDGGAYASGSGASASFTPDDNGTYVLTINATDKDLGVGSSISTITVTNVAPVASFTSAPTTGAEGAEISFSGSATDVSAADTTAGFTVTWTVTKNGDPFAAGTGTNINFAPDDNGDYLLTVTATDKDNASSSATSDIAISNVAPTVTVIAPTAGDEGSAISASAGATDPSSVDTAAGFIFSWSVTKDGGAFASGSGAAASFVPDDNASYEITFSATDKDGGLSSSSATITVNNVAPTVDVANAPATGSEGSPVFVTGATVSDPSSADTAAGFTTTWAVTKNGDAFASGTGLTFAFVPDDNGSYVFTITATDKDGGIGSTTGTVAVANVAPSVNLSSPSTGVEGAAITASAFAFDPSSADRNAGLVYSWTVTKNNAPFTSGTGSLATFTPDDNGTYVLTVSATDKDSGVGSASQSIEVANAAPSYSGSGASSFSDEGTTITSTADATDPSSADTTAGLTYAWSVTKDGNAFASGAGDTAVFTPDDNGLFVLTQTATDKDGGLATTSSTIHVTNVAPTVSLPGAPTAGNEGSAISYSGASAGDPSSADTAAGFTYSWSVTKNGNAYASGSGANATFTPNDNGAYVLTITASDKDGGSSSASANITVANVAPTVALNSAPSTGNEGSAISFTAAASDVSTADTAAGLSLTWTVKKNGSAYASGTGSTIAFTPNDNGAYAVTVTATDKDGGASSTTANIAVANVAPTVSLSNVPTSGNEGSPVTFAVSASATDPSSVDTAAGFTTTWSVTKNGSPFASGSGSSVSFTPNDNGTYVLTLSVTDKDGGAGSAGSTINVLNVAPTVSLTNVPTTGNEGTAISFTAGSSISDPSTVDTAAGFTISWSVTKNGAAYASGNGTAIAFTPNDNGTYVLTLSAADKDGGSGSASRTIAVANVAPTITSATVTPSTAVRLQTINFAGAFTDPGSLDNPTATWTFGDGATAAGATASHVYTSTGTFTATLKVTDKDGAVTTTTKQVTVLAVTLEVDPVDSTKTALYIGGTNANDTITVNPGGGSGNGAQVIINGSNLGVFNPTGHIVILGGDGDDNIQLAGSVNFPSEIFAGNGNDKVKGSNATNIISGGDGNDILVGGNNRDLLIGGNGADQITGGGNDDILVASATAFDNSSSALESIMKEWTRTDTCFADRVIHLLYGGGLNGSTTINTDTVFADTNSDTLTGSSGDDLFVFNTNDDIVDFNLLQDAGAIDLNWIIVPF